jgi:hypothetical protein
MRKNIFPLGSCDICHHPAWLQQHDRGPVLRTLWMCKVCKRHVEQTLQGLQP